VGERAQDLGLPQELLTSATGTRTLSDIGGPSFSVSATASTTFSTSRHGRASHSEPVHSLPPGRSHLPTTSQSPPLLECCRVRF
jgi:hypothetical protein